MFTPLLLYSLLIDASILNHHHGKVVVSLAMRPCIQLLALEEASPSSKMSPALLVWYENSALNKIKKIKKKLDQNEGL